MNQLQQHITEYREQIEEHRRAITALTGAIQALERLEKENMETTANEKGPEEKTA